MFTVKLVKTSSIKKLINSKESELHYSHFHVLAYWGWFLVLKLKNLAVLQRIGKMWGKIIILRKKLKIENIKKVNKELLKIWNIKCNWKIFKIEKKKWHKFDKKKNQKKIGELREIDIVLPFRLVFGIYSFLLKGNFLLGVSNVWKKFLFYQTPIYLFNKRNLLSSISLISQVGTGLMTVSRLLFALNTSINFLIPDDETIQMFILIVFIL